MIALEDELRFVFQAAFAKVDEGRSRQFSVAHSALAEMLHEGFLELVISANWDTQLERAYEQRYGVRRLPETWYAKPQGDASEARARWVLPGETRSLPDVVLGTLSRLKADYPRHLLIAGYAEQDQEIVRQVIRPVEERSTVTRISPNASGPSSIRHRAEDVLPGIAGQLRDPAQPPWRYVNFSDQRDIGRALAGGGLGPQDARACPEVPTVKELVDLLRLAHSTLLQGPSGSGKSLVCYQAAAMLLSDEGYECIQLTEVPEDMDAAMAQLRALRRPTVLIVEDGQQLSDSAVETLLSAGSERIKIVIATTVEEGTWGRVAVRLTAVSTVRVLQGWCLGQKSILLPLISNLDRMVGEGYLDEPFETSGGICCQVVDRLAVHVHPRRRLATNSFSVGSSSWK